MSEIYQLAFIVPLIGRGFGRGVNFFNPTRSSSYRWFSRINEANDSFSIALTYKPRRHVAVNKRLPVGATAMRTIEIRLAYKI